MKFWSHSKAIWLLAAVFGLVVVLESVWPGGESVAPSVSAPTLAEPGPVRLADPVGLWTTAILARPLFNPTRRPDTTAVPVVAPDHHDEPPRLTGIVVSAGRSQAIFAPADGKDRSIVASEGTAVGAWTVTAIRAGEVWLSGPDGARVLRPSYLSGAAAAEPVSQPPAGGNGLLPSAPTDTRPFDSVTQPSGAAIISNMLRSQASRRTQ